MELVEPQIHSFETDCLPEEHPLARISVGCGHCGAMVHAFNNECMKEWVEWANSILCLECFCVLFKDCALDIRMFVQYASTYPKERDE